MAVIAILGILMSLLIYGMGPLQRKAKTTGSEAVVQSVKAAIDAYYNQFRQYPPDGYDAPVMRRPATGAPAQIRGSQCLIYFLGYRVPVVVEVGQDQRVQEVGPFLEITADMLSGEGDLDEKLAKADTEIVDKFGNALHYDDLSLKDAAGNYMGAEQSDTHLQGGDSVRAPDPRRPQQGGATGATSGGGIGRNKGAYDLWSHGVSISDPADDITNWK